MAAADILFKFLEVEQHSWWRRNLNSSTKLVEHEFLLERDSPGKVNEIIAQRGSFQFKTCYFKFSSLYSYNEELARLFILDLFSSLL